MPHYSAGRKKTPMSLQLTPDTGSMASRIFTAHRLSAYPLIFLTVYIVAAIAWMSQVTDLIDPRQKPIGYDFITFWGASWLTLQGDAAAVFDAAKMFAAEKVAVPGSDKVFLWHYPPTFLAIVLPLSLFPYIWSYLIWTTGTFAGYAWVVRKMAPQPQTLLLLCAFPGTFMNFFHGQNGFLTAALFGGAMLVLERRPIAAGILIGLLSYKPHFGLLLPLALLCGRHWTSFFWAAGTTVAFAALSVAAFGVDTWIAFWDNAPLARAVFEDGLVRWAKIPSAFAALRLAGAGLTVAYAVQITIAVCIAATVALIWWRRPPLPLRAATLVAGTLAATPYLFDYDFALLAIPIALIAMDGYLRGWNAGERPILVVAWVMPLVSTGIAEWTNVQVGPACVLALFVIAARRALATQDRQRRTPVSTPMKSSS